MCISCHDFASVSKPIRQSLVIDDAMILRNHVINMLEQADVESQDKELKRSLITFVVVGGASDDFVSESIRHYYHDVVITYFSNTSQ